MLTIAEPAAPLCRHCNQPMQLNFVNTDGVTGREINRQYICGCTRLVHFVNVHAGQGGRR
jgi:hypothetical protein